MLFIITGVRGAGKTTLRNALIADGKIEALQASTTRAPRNEDDKEYQFLSRWRSDRYGWEVEVGGEKYGLRKTELEKAIEGNFLVVCDPLTIDVVNAYIGNSSIEAVTIGLDTIDNLSTLEERVGFTSDRLMTLEDFDRARNVIQASDLVLSGAEGIVFDAALAAIDLLVGRGGVVTAHHLLPLMKAGSVLVDTKLETELKSASYDLRVGDQVWCKGVLIKLESDSPTFEIPPYSYAIVSAREEAWLPTFLSGRFDIKISLFLQGIILSNGPQVDPGYRGPLFCMLFNGSSDSRTLAMDTHFATIEFSTISRITQPYSDKYQLNSRLESVMSEGGLSGQGGNIIQKFEGFYQKTNSRLDNLSTWAWGTAIACILGVAGFIITPSIWIQDQLNLAEKYANDTKELIEADAKARAAALTVIKSEKDLAIKDLQDEKDQILKSIKNTVP